MHKRHFLRLSAVVGAGLLAPWAATVHAESVASTSTPEAVVRHYAVLVQAGYEDSLAGAQALQRAVQAFVAAPSEQSLAAARQAWLNAREWYGQTEAFRFYGGPIDDDRGPEGRINAWPLDEAYIDSVQGKPKSGLVNDPRVVISRANLARLNEKGGEENIATGWHAVEFLLWGQDLSETGPGSRSHEDFIDGKAPNAARRRQYLSVVTELLVDDLRYLAVSWAPSARNYRRRFEAGGRESLRKIIVGMGSLSRGELAGERMEVAVNTQDQEDEHSCFSDNTHRDMYLDALGVQNVWKGQYRGIDGALYQGTGTARPTPWASRTSGWAACGARMGPCCRGPRCASWWPRATPGWPSARPGRSQRRWLPPRPSRRRSTGRSSVARTRRAASASRRPSTAWCSRARIWWTPRRPSASRV
jgi:putative iron-regulated protein